MRPTSAQALLSWSTASETSNAYFAIERSADGHHFTEIGQVAGAGTTRETRHYTFRDEQPLRGINYYRLRQMDQDGSFAYSPVRFVEFRSNTPVRIFPSPVREVLQVQWAEPVQGVFSWEILDLAGRLLAQGQSMADVEAWTIPVHTVVTPGHYRLRLTTDRQTWVQGFIKY
ncbi:MAG: hypothetical protein IPM98_09515 [Lewinellaceae bacterium]|nr:hypothetical protein [Lewinellaceae bacterium]